MHVEVKLFARLNKYDQEKKAAYQVELDPGSSVVQFVEKLGIPPKVIGLVPVFWTFPNDYGNVSR